MCMNCAFPQMRHRRPADEDLWHRRPPGADTAEVTCHKE